MMTKLKFLWVLLALLVGGVNGAWADEVYTVTSDGSTINTSTGTAAFTTSTLYQATEHVQLYIGSAWNISSGKITGTAQPANGNGTYDNQNNYLLPTSGSYLRITPSQNGSITVNGSKNSGGNKYLHIQTSNTNFVSDATVTCGGNTCVWTSGRNGYNVNETSGNIVATFSVQSGTTYYVFFNQFNDWSFTGFTFSKQKIDVAASDFGFLYTYRNTHSGDTYEGNPLVNRLNLPVTYSSSNTSAATINSSTGEITIQTVTGGIESTKITARFAGNDDYNAKDVTYSLNVAPALVYTDISVANLRYQPGINGISGTQLNRSVGGFDLTFGENEGIKCNNTNNFYFRTNGSGAKGSMTIALDANNSGSNYIKKIVFTAWGTPSLSVNSVARTSGTLTQTGASEWTWTQYYDNVRTVTFTSQGENDESILISNIRVYTNSAPIFSKVTPVPGFNRNSDSFSTGASVNISDLTISTTPSSFLFDYTYDAGFTTLAHTPYTNNTTWPGTITGTAANGTATIAASFSDSSNPFYDIVASTNVYTLTVSSAAKNTFVWDFTQGLSEIDTKLLTADETNWKKSGNLWKPNIEFTDREIYATTNGNNNPLELTYGLKVAKWTKDNSSFIDASNKNIRLRGTSDDITIPNLQVGDIITIVSRTANTDNARGLNTPSNVSVTSGFTTSKEQVTNVGTVTAAGDVKLTVTDHVNIYSITVESTNKPWPTLSFANGSSVNAEIPYGSSSTTYSNALTSVPTGSTATYSILLDKNAGGASAANINSSTGEITINATGEIIVRATVSAGTYNSAYYCDYILNVTQGTQYAEWTYTADSKEIDGEVRPYQGTVTFTKGGEIAGGTEITDVPGITMKIGKTGGKWTVYNNTASGRFNGLVANFSTIESSDNIFIFSPVVNGYLTLTGNYYGGNTDAKELRMEDENGVRTVVLHNTNNYSGLNISFPLIAGKTYTLTNGPHYNNELHSFTFRPAFLTPDETTEQTATFEAYSSTTEFPKLVHSADAGVRFSGNRSVVNLSSDGGVTLVGGGTAVVRGKVISGDNALTAYYTLESNVLSVESTIPANGATITTLDNNSFYVQFNANISTTIDATKIVVLKDAETLTGITVSRADNSYNNFEKVLKISNFPTPLEAGSTYTIRIMSGCVQKDDNATVKNPEYIGTFIVESTEPPLTWFYPTTTSAVRIGTSIVLKTDEKIDEHYPAGGIWGELTYEGSENDDDYPMVIKAVKDDNKIVFKPAQPLEPNKLYTLKVAANQVKYSGSTNMITKDKVFLFTTGTGTGAAPTVTGNNSNSWSHDAGIVKLTFNVNIELEPYSTISLTPINGNEPTASGTSAKLDNSGVLTGSAITVSGNELSFNFSKDELKYDLWYKLVLPNNTVTGPGGMPNSEDYVYTFKMAPKSSDKLVTTAFPGYPYTWDFTKFGLLTGTLTTLGGVKDSKTTSRWQEPLKDNVSKGYYSNYVNGNTNSGPFFPQGEVASYNNGSTDVEISDMKGLRWSLVKYYGSGNDRMQIPKTGTSLNLVGGTHYLTIPNVPAGKLYIKARNQQKFDINTPGVTFTQGGQEDNTKGSVDSGQEQVFIINVPTAGDVSFCLQDVNFKIIAVATDEKVFKQSFSEGEKTYATDRLTYDVRYDLPEVLTEHNVKAYYVTNIADNPEDNTAIINAREVTNGVAGANQGVIVLYQGGVSADTSVPVFKADVNSAEQSGQTNELKVIASGTETVPTPADNNYMYVLSNQGSKSDGVAFYRYTGSKFSDRAAYLEVPKYMVNPSISGGSARAFRMVFHNEDGSETTLIRTVEKDGVAERAEQAGGYYDLRGQRLAKPNKRGLYIKDGKKIYVK